MSALRIHRAPIGVSLQDAGRTGYLRYGISSAGPMDWARHAMANAMLAKPLGHAAIEVGPAGIGLSLESGRLQMSFAGPGFEVKLGDLSLTGPLRFVLEAGQLLEVVPRAGAMWGYLGFGARIEVAPLLGSLSENSVSGLYARKITSGSRLPLRCGDIEHAGVQSYIDPYIALENQPLGILPSSQFEQFSPENRTQLVSKSLRIAPRFDRMAYQLSGLLLSCDKGHDILSDGVTMGAIQVPGDSRPFVLMADHQPTGGYPKIACICKVDLPRMAQMAPGKRFTLQWVRPEQGLQRWLFMRDRIQSLKMLKGI